MRRHWTTLSAGMSLTGALIGGLLVASPAGAAEPADSIFERAVGDAAQPSASLNPDVDIPETAQDPVRLQGDGALLLHLPGEGNGSTDEHTTVFGSGPDRVAVEPLDDGVRAMVEISGPSSPERFDFDFDGAVADLRLTPDGGVTVLDSHGAPLAVIDAPWARDAAGSAVPTHYEVEGTTLTQVVEHRGGDWEYSIVADPSLWKITKCAASVALVFIPGRAAYKAIKALGGVRKTARLLVGAGNADDFVKIAGGAAAEILGIDGLAKNCF